MSDPRGKVKVLCKWDKSRCRERVDELRRIVSNPRHLCEDCGRVAAEDVWLCKPVKL